MKTRMRNVILRAMLAVLLTTGAGYADLTEGLVAYYPLNGNANDESGNGNNGTVYGATFGSGLHGQALSFDGIDSYVEVPDAPELDVTSAVTMSAFVYPLSLSGYWGKMIFFRRQAYNYRNQLTFDIRTDTGRPCASLEFSNGDTGLIYASESLSMDTWYHVAVVYDGTSLRMYLNGDLSTTQTKTTHGNDLNGQTIVSSEYPLAIGRSYDGPDPAHVYYRYYYEDNFHGQIDDARLYNRALSAHEMRQLINSPPVVTITRPSSGFLAAVNTPIQFTGMSDDPDVGDTHAAVWTMTSENGSENRDGTVSGTSVNNFFQFSQAGIYSISLTVADAAGESDTATTVNDLPAFIVVYDPSAGFVTGGGWIDSPAYALLDSLAAGKATFGFVAKYKQGATAPQGNTEFQFQAGDFRFKSSSYDWLVIAGSKAMFKGEGYIDGMGGGFKFMLTAVDGPEDKFRIKIWNPITDDVIYDNKRGEGDDAEPTTIGGGSIVIHKK